MAPSVGCSTKRHIAIIGMAGRFPGAPDVPTFWSNLLAGRETITRLSDEPLAEAGLDPASVRADPAYAAARGLIDKPEFFDAAFFGISPKEAAVMDPQHRIFLEEAWIALEDAGCLPEKFGGAIGVFAGMSNSSYFAENVARHPELAGALTAMVGHEKDSLATRVAYELNLRGPALNISTAGSTSLVAVCQACSALQNRQCDVALAGGVSIPFPQTRGRRMEEGATPPDGRSRVFDERTAGTVFGSGAGVVVLKRLSEAIADGDQIYAVIKGMALNNDESAKVSFTSPSVEGHARLLALAQANAAVAPETISYIEAHGTGAAVEDPIEIDALIRAFGGGRTLASGFCAIGSVKANIGHLDAASGVAGLIKTALALKHGVLPPTVHFSAPGAKTKSNDSPFYINTERRDWPPGKTPRRAGVSSFGIGGTNAHIILEEAPALETAPESASVEMLALSARTAAALDDATRELSEYLGNAASAANPPALADVAHSLQTGRREFNHRRVVICSSLAEAANATATLAKETVFSGVTEAGSPPVAFMFPGPGAQRAAMGAQLYASEPLFREVVDECAAKLSDELELDLRTILLDASGHAAEQLQRTRFTQPSLFVIAYALARLWMARAVQPMAMIGHSVGEYVAATLAGVFSLDDALRTVATRARLMEAQPAGAMLALRLSEAELEPLLGEQLSIAAINAPLLCVASGPFEAINGLQAQLRERGVASRRLRTSHAFHSAMIEEAVAPFIEAVRSVRLHAPRSRFISNVTGDWITDAQAIDPEYWGRQMRVPVRFADGVKTLLDADTRILLECGPSAMLTQLASQHPSKTSAHETIPSLEESGDEQIALALALGKLWLTGVSIDWRVVHRNERRRRLALPSYPFERERFWAEAPRVDDAEASASAASKPCAAEAVPTEETPGASTRKENLLRCVRDELRRVSDIDWSEKDSESSFIERGFDSLLLIQTALALQQRFQVPLTFRRLSEDLSTPAALAEWLDENLSSDATLLPSPATATKPGAAVERDGHGRLHRNDLGGGDELTRAQKKHVDDLTARYTTATAESKRLAESHRLSLANSQPALRSQGEEMTYPIVMQRALGSKFWDVDGNEYVDITMGFGDHLLGHRPSIVVEAIEKQLESGLEVGATSPLAAEVTALLRELTGHDRVAFCNAAADAVTAALRIARTVTGRAKIALFTGACHGMRKDALLPAPDRIAEVAGDVMVLDYGSDESLALLRAHAGELAAVLVEPVQRRRPEVQPRAFLQELRALTNHSGTVLIFDEVVTGFRAHPGGAQAFFGVNADIAIYGSVVAGGMPIGLIIGAGRFLDAPADRRSNCGEQPGRQMELEVSGAPFVSHSLALTAARAILQHLKTEGPKLQANLNERTSAFVAQLNAHLAMREVPVRWTQFSSLFHLRVSAELPHADLIWHHLRARGVNAWKGQPSFLSTAHSDADLAHVLNAFKESVDALVGERLLPGNLGESDSLPRSAARSENELLLTDAQREIFLATQSSVDANSGFHESARITLHGALDVPRLRTALNAVIGRHDALRTVFPPEGRIQCVTPALEIELPEFDLSKQGAAAQEDEQQSRLEKERLAPFDLSKGPLLRAMVLHQAPDQAELWLTVHRIICDRWSLGMLAKEIGEGYGATLAERPPASQFREYAAWLHASHEAASFERTEAYWLRQLADLPSPLNLPVDRPRTNARTSNSARRRIDLPTELLAELKRFSARERCTLFTTMLAAFHILLHRLSAESDIVVGITAAGQAASGDEMLVGQCAHCLPIRMQIGAEATAGEFVRTVKSLLVEAIEHQHFPFGMLLQKLGLPPDARATPVFSAAFNIDCAPRHLRFGEVSAAWEKDPALPSGLELSFDIVAEKRGTQLHCTFNRELFDDGTIDRWLGYYVNLVRDLTADGKTQIRALAMMSPSDRETILVEWNAIAKEFPRDRSIQELFEAWVARTPDAIAVADGASWTSYAELNALANRFADDLHKRGVKVGDYVGVPAVRGTRFIAAIIGILKAGGAYLPLDSEEPAARLAVMREACKTVVELDYGPRCEQAANPPAQAGANDPAHLLFTPGSTGLPRGVAVPHQAISRLVINPDYVEIRQDDAVAFASNVAHDIATFEIWGALLNGATVVVVPRDVLLSPEALGAHLLAHSVTTIFLTTPLFNQIAGQLPAILAPMRTVLFGGEPADRDSIMRVLQNGPPRRLVHVYGSAETTTFATFQLIEGDPGNRVPIGRPIANTPVYILDAALEPVPIGVPGEICIGGPGVALHYHAAPDVTAERFVETTYGRLYRSRDRGRWRADGTIEYLGRMDTQIKLRGFRIEPREIEAALRRVPGIAECAVIARDLGLGDRRLFAYFTLTNGSEPLQTTLREEVSRAVPAYMVPSAFVRLDKFPLTRNGKLDENALPLPAAKASRPDIERPESVLHVQLAEIWEKVLKCSPVGVRDSFFELGGHSLLAVQMLAEMEARIGRSIPLAALCEEPTIARLADCLVAEERRASSNAPVVQIQNGDAHLPFFFLHGDFSGGFYSRELARQIGEDRPFYAIPPHGLHGEEVPATVEQMAEALLHEIVSKQPKGPYYLGGFASGGVIAFEMARQLEARGEEVAVVLMLAVAGLNASHRGGHRSADSSARNHSSHTKRFHRWRRNLERALGGKGAEPAGDLAGEPAAESHDPLHGYLEALDAYVPGRYAGRVALLWPSEHQLPDGADPRSGWSDVCKKLELIPVAGDQQTTLGIEENIRALGKQIRGILDAAARPTAVSAQ